MIDRKETECLFSILLLTLLGYSLYFALSNIDRLFFTSDYIYVVFLSITTSFFLYRSASLLKEIVQ